MAEMTVQTVSRSGVTPTYQTLSASDTFANDGQTVLLIKNGHSVDCTVTAAITRTIDGVTPTGKSITVPATTGEKLFGPFSPQDYGSTVTITTSHQTSMTAACFKIS